MFVPTTQQNQIKNIARKAGVRFNNTDSFELVVFKMTEKLLKRIEKLEKTVKDLDSDDE